MSIADRQPGAASARFVTLGVGMAVLACLALLVVRVSSAVTWDRPFLGQTSGLEEEALFSLWKAHHHQPVYTDVLALPFSASYFNGLFYTVYAAWGRTWGPLLSLSDAWLPTVWRCLSLLFCGGAWIVLAGLLRQLSTHHLTFRQAMAAAALAVFTPLFHWMSFSARPDLSALFAETLTLAALLMAVRRDSSALVLAAGAAAALAWSFKQSEVYAFAGGFVFFACHHRWRDLGLFMLPLAVTVLLTMALLGEGYRQNTVTMHIMASQFDVMQGLKFALSAMAKAPCMLGGLVLLLPLALKWRNLGLECRLLSIVTGVSLPLCLFTSSKVGAADYYYLAPAVFASVLLFASLPFISQRLVSRALITLATLQVAAVALIFSGSLGKASVRGDQALAVRLQGRLAGETGPVFVTGRPYNLPWLHPGRPAFVFAYLYDQYERSHPQLREQGLRSLVRDRYFNVVVDVDDPALDFSAELKASYELAEAGEGFRLYRPRQQ